jgi:LPXTG-motif cell wall-anchored protein
VNWTDSAGPVDPVKQIFTDDFTFDCVHPGATITHSCAEGVQIHFTNTGDSALEMTVTKNGNVIDTVGVAAHGTADRTYTMDEDETSTYRVSGGGFDSGAQQFTHDCVEASTTTTSTTSTTAPTTTSTPDTVAGEEITRGTTLPRTGSSSTLPMTTMAGLLLMAGGLLLAAVNRPMPATASATSRRSRGR